MIHFSRAHGLLLNCRTSRDSSMRRKTGKYKCINVSVSERNALSEIHLLGTKKRKIDFTRGHRRRTLAADFVKEMCAQQKHNNKYAIINMLCTFQKGRLLLKCGRTQKVFFIGLSGIALCFCSSMNSNLEDNRRRFINSIGQTRNFEQIAQPFHCVSRSFLYA
jgi:hypothetical protein